MSSQRRRDWVAKNMKKFNHGSAHKSKRDYKRKTKKEVTYEYEANKEML